MKKLLASSLTILALLAAGCEEEGIQTPRHLSGTTLQDFPPVENLQFRVIGDGSAIELTWDPPASVTPKEYLVSVDSVDQMPVTVPMYDVMEPAVLIEVYAVYAQGRSEPRTLHFGAMETAELVLWATEWYSRAPCSRTRIVPGLLEQKKGERFEVEVRPTDHPHPDDPSGFGFDSEGTAVAYDLSDTTTWPEVDYYVVDFGGADLAIANPEVHEPPLNMKVNGITDPIKIDYDDLVMVPNDGYYNYADEIVVGGVYALWTEVYGPDDHCVKIQITQMEGIQLTLKLAYQPVEGLRWVIVEERPTGIKED